MMSPTRTMAYRWLDQANRHDQAARECDTSRDECLLHLETSRTLRLCALELIRETEDDE